MNVNRIKAREYLQKRNIKLLKCNIDFVEYYIIEDKGHLPIKELDTEKLFIFRGKVKKKKRRRPKLPKSITMTLEQRDDGIYLNGIPITSNGNGKTYDN